MRGGESIRSLGLFGFGIVGTAGAACCVVLAPRAALTGWMAAAVLVQAVPLGALVLLAMMRLIAGQWEAELRCACEAAAGLWVVGLLAFLPVLFGMGLIYDWPHMHLETAFQDAWLSPVPFIARALLWFAALAVIACNQVGGRASEGSSALALVVLTLGASLTAVDWLMSLDPGFHSSGFGLTVFALEMCVAYAVVVLLRLMQPPVPRNASLLGGLLIVFLLLWLYFQFMPYLVIWSGNLPDGVKWYLDRAVGPWAWVLWASGLLGAAPLLALCLPQVRRSPRAVGFAGISTLAGKVLEFAWLALPGRGGMSAVTYAFALCGLGCFAAAYLSPDRVRWPPCRRSTA